MVNREEVENRIMNRTFRAFFACYGAAIIVITFFFLLEDRLFVGNLRMENFEEVVVTVCMFAATIITGICFFVSVAIETVRADKT